MQEFVLCVLAAVLALLAYVFSRRSDPGDISRWRYDRRASEDLERQETSAAEDRRRKHEDLKRRLDALKSRLPKPKVTVILALIVTLTLPGVARADAVDDLAEAVAIAEQYQQLYLAAEESNGRLVDEIARLQQIIDEQQKMIEDLRRPRLAPWAGLIYTSSGPGVAVGISF